VTVSSYMYIYFILLTNLNVTLTFDLQTVLKFSQNENSEIEIFNIMNNTYWKVRKNTIAKPNSICVSLFRCINVNILIKLRGTGSKN